MGDDTYTMFASNVALLEQTVRLLRKAGTALAGAREGVRPFDPDRRRPRAGAAARPPGRRAGDAGGGALRPGRDHRRPHAAPGRRDAPWPASVGRVAGGGVRGGRPAVGRPDDPVDQGLRAESGDKGVDPDDPVHVSDVANCHGCRVEYDNREPSLDPRIAYCADHDPEELRTLLGDAIGRRGHAPGGRWRSSPTRPTRRKHRTGAPAPRIGGDLATIARVARAALRGEPEEPGR